MNNRIIVITTIYPHEAHLIEGFLNSHGIETSLKDEITVQLNTAYSNAVGGIKILVSDSDYDKSIQLLKDGGYITDPGKNEDNDQQVFLVEYTTNHKNCPFCNSDHITIKKKPNTFSFIISLLISLLLFATIAPIYKSIYKCFDCDKEWKYKRN